MILINIQPMESTVVRVDQNPEFPPSLVITDGHATVWFAPSDSPDGPMLAAEFAGRLVDCAHRWHAICRAQAAYRQPPEPPARRQVEWAGQAPEWAGRSVMRAAAGRTGRQRMIGCTDLAGRPRYLIVFTDSGRVVLVAPPGETAALSVDQARLLASVLADEIGEIETGAGGSRGE